MSEDCDEFTGLHIEIDRIQRPGPSDDISLVVLFQIVVDQLLRNNHVFLCQKRNRRRRNRSPYSSPAVVSRKIVVCLWLKRHFEPIRRARS